MSDKRQRRKLTWELEEPFIWWCYYDLFVVNWSKCQPETDSSITGCSLLSLTRRRTGWLAEWFCDCGVTQVSTHANVLHLRKLKTYSIANTEGFLRNEYHKYSLTLYSICGACSFIHWILQWHYVLGYFSFPVGIIKVFTKLKQSFEICIVSDILYHVYAVCQNEH